MDKLFYNGKIFTMDKERPQVNAIGTKGEKICFAGNIESADEIEAKEKFDLGGRCVLPGFNDSHMHLAIYSFANNNARTFDCRSVQDCLDTIAAYRKERPEATWIYGRGWNEQNFDGEKRYPTKEELDAVCSDVPVMIVRACGHAAVCNSKAMEKIVKLPQAAQMPDRVHPESGVVAEAGVKLFYSVIDEPSSAYVKDLLTKGMEDLLKKGITTCQSDDLLSVPGCGWEKVLGAYFELAREKSMKVRIYEQCLFLNQEEFEKFLAKGYRTGNGDDYFKIGPLKLLLDGSLGARTAALNVPYVGTDDNYGILVFSQEEMDKLVETAHASGMQIAVHCIGDRAMDVMLSAVEKAQKKYPRKDCRHGIVHAQLTHFSTLDRMKADDVIAYIQPVFVGTDMDIVEARVGKSWMQETYAWKTMIDKGILTAGGSDAPVESFDVMENIYFAVTRKRKDGTPEGGWLPEQKLSVYEAVEAFTTKAAKACFQEDSIGKLAPGMNADAVVLAKNLFDVPQDEIKDIKVLATIVGGKIAYGSLD